MGIYMLLIPFMAFIARACGGGVGVEFVEANIKNAFLRGFWRRLPEIAFAIPFGWIAAQSSGVWYIGVLGGILSFFAMEMGHGTFYNMTGYDYKANPTGKRIQTIEQFMRLFYVGVFGGNIYRPLYSWLCMGLKGLLIGLAAYPFGLLLAVFWPFSYWLSRNVMPRTESAEWISGGFAGAVIFATYLYLFSA